MVHIHRVVTGYYLPKFNDEYDFFNSNIRRTNNVYAHISLVVVTSFLM